MSRKFIYDASGTVIRELHLDDSRDFYKGGAFSIRENCDPLVRQTQHERDVLDHVGKPHDNFRKAANVPITVYEQSLREHWTQKEWATWLNDPANRDFRVWGGNI